MRTPKIAILTLAFAAAALSQNLYVTSDLQVDDSTGDVTASGASSTDYLTAYYYDLGLTEYLYFQPNGGSQAVACSSANYSSVDTYVPTSCTYNLGSQSGDLTLETLHHLNITYQDYQIEDYCTWDCDYYDDYYGYSLISTSPSYDGDQTFYAPGSATPVSNQQAIQASLYKNAHRGACVYPSSETTLSYGFNPNFHYLAQFVQVLNGGSFNGRYVVENFNTPASDQCWRPANGGSPLQNPAGTSPWYVSGIKMMDASGFAAYIFSYPNAWGYDHIGFYGSSGATTLYNYVQNMRQASSACSVSFNQNMYMYCSGLSGPGQYYHLNNALNIVIVANPSTASVTIERDTTQQNVPYP